MQRAVVFILIPIILIVAALWVILFTPFGSNAVIKPVANSYLSSKIKEPKIKITKLDSKYKYIDVSAVADNGVKIDAKGEIDYFKKDFNLNYALKADSLKIKDKELQAKVDVNGQAVGTIENVGVNGKGKAFDSEINYNFIVKDNNPQKIEAKIDSANIEQILALAGIEPYIGGYADVDINMPDLNIKNPRGSGVVTVRNGRYNRNLLAKKFKIVLPRDETFKAKIVSKIAKNRIFAKGKVVSTTAVLNLSKVVALPDFSVAKGYFDLKISNLSRLNRVAKMKLRGKFSSNGVFYINRKKNIILTKIETKSFGGKAAVNYKNKRVKAVLDSVYIPKIFYMLSLPSYISKGLLSGTVYIKNIDKLNGQFNISSSGVLNRKLLKVKLPSYSYKIKTKGSITNGTVKANKSSLYTNFANIYLSNTVYSIPSGSFKTAFTADIKNLAALKVITKQNLRGPLKFGGKVSKLKSLINLSGSTRSLGGEVKINLSGSNLNVLFNTVSIPRVLYMISQPKIVKKGAASGNLKLNSLQPPSGTFDIISKGVIDNRVLQKVYNINLGRDAAYVLNAKNGTIKRGVIRVSPILKTSLGVINLKNLVYNSLNGNLHAFYTLSIDNLEKLYPLTKQKLKGDFLAGGEIKYKNGSLYLDGDSKKFGGTLHFILNDSVATVDIAGASVIQITRMLDLQEFLDATAKAHLIYNTKTKQGKFNIDLNDARFLNSRLVAALKQFARFDLSKELFSAAKIYGTINSGIITFNLNTDSQRTKITIRNGKIDTNSQQINAKVHFVYNNNDYQVRVLGDLKNPHIKPVFGGYIKEKVKEKVLEKLFGKKLKNRGKDKNGTDTNATTVKPQEQLKQKLQEKTKKEINKIVPKEIKGILKNLPF